MVIAHEIVHSANKAKEPGVVLKLDYEKAYDRVELDFLFEIVESRGFGPKYISWIRSLVVGGSVAVTLNGEDSNYFKTSRGLRQGDPMSLFNLVGDVLTRMLMKAANQGLIKGLLTRFREQGVISL